MRMPRVISALRASVLFTAVGVAACVPGIATEWWQQSDPSFPVPAASRPSSAHVEDAVPPGTMPLTFDDDEAPPGQFDLRGNEILRPVERYGVDGRGSLYELHSPHTEVPRLGPPEL